MCLKKRKVLFVVTEIFKTGGIQRFNRNLLDAWNELEIELTVVSLNELVIEDKLRKRYPDFKIYYALGNKIRFISLLIGVMIKRRFDKVICGHFNLSQVLMIIGFLTMNNSNMILIIHGIEVWKNINKRHCFLLHKFKFVLAASNYTKKRFLDQVAGFSESKISIFPNTINTTNTRSQISRISRSQQKKNKYFKLLSVCRLAKTEREKGLRYVIDAMTILDSREYLYYIVGEGDDKDDLQLYANSQGLTHEVKFLGELDDKELWIKYLNSSVFLLPSKKEGFGIVFLEAMSFSLPVIAAAEKGALDVIKHNYNGLLVEYGNAKQIADAIIKLRNDSELYNQLVCNSLSLVTPGGKFSFEQFKRRTKKYLT